MRLPRQPRSPTHRGRGSSDDGGHRRVAMETCSRRGPRTEDPRGAAVPFPALRFVGGHFRFIVKSWLSAGQAEAMLATQGRRFAHEQDCVRRGEKTLPTACVFPALGCSPRSRGPGLSFFLCLLAAALLSRPQVPNAVSLLCPPTCLRLPPGVLCPLSLRPLSRVSVVSLGLIYVVEFKESCEVKNYLLIL